MPNHPRPFVLGVGGEPAAGKSALAARVLATLGPGEPFSFGLLRGTRHRGAAVYAFGVYDGAPYPGTDRLSMAVQPAAAAFVAAAAGGQIPGFRAAFFEGDRLFNPSFLALCAALLPRSRFLVLLAPEGVKAARRAGRGDTKPPGFLKGRASKYLNILAAPGPAAVETAVNATPADLDALAARLAAALNAGA